MLKSRIREKQAAWLVLVLVGWLAACTEKTPCDDDQVLRDGFCYTVDAGPAFGQACAASTECVAPTEYCAIQPGQSAGFCTAFGCDLSPAICPPDWTCMDLTPYGLAAHMCAPSQ